MPAPTDTDIERILTPIATDAPAGVSLRYEGTYEKIREARREDDASLPAGVWERSLKSADPGAVAALCEAALEKRSKDLQLAAWLADAWVLLHGFVGVERGITLLRGLCERFWDTLFPTLDEDGDEARLQTFEWIDDTFARRIRAVKLGDDRGPFTLFDWERAGTDAQADDGTPLTHESLLARISLMGTARWSAMYGEVSAALAAAAALVAALSTRTKSPEVLSRTEKALRAAQSLAEGILKAAGASLGPTPQGASSDGARAADGKAGGRPDDAREGHVAMAASAGQLSSRAEAYRRLTEAADYLLRTEPHSPVPYLVKRAISWGNMSLAQVLQEFISSSDDLVSTQRLLGMRQRDE